MPLLRDTRELCRTSQGVIQGENPEHGKNADRGKKRVSSSELLLGKYTKRTYDHDESDSDNHTLRTHPRPQKQHRTIQPLAICSKPGYKRRGNREPKPDIAERHRRIRSLPEEAEQQHRHQSGDGIGNPTPDRHPPAKEEDQIKERIEDERTTDERIALESEKIRNRKEKRMQYRRRSRGNRRAGGKRKRKTLRHPPRRLQIKRSVGLGDCQRTVSVDHRPGEPESRDLQDADGKKKSGEKPPLFFWFKQNHLRHYQVVVVVVLLSVCS